MMATGHSGGRDTPPPRLPFGADAEAYRSLLAGAPVVIFALDIEGRFLMGEGRGLETLGLQPNEWVGRSVFDVYAGDPLVVAHARRALAGEEFTAVSAVGKLRFETRWGPLRARDGTRIGTLGVASDVTERERAAHFEQTLAEISQRVLAVSSAELEEVIEESLGRAARQAEADRANLLLVGPSGRVERSFRWAGDDRDCPPPPSDPEAVKRFRWSARRLIHEDQPFLVERLADLPPEAQAERRDLEARGVRSLLGISVRGARTFFGYLSFECLDRERSWDALDLRLLRVVGEMLAGAVNRAQAEAALRESEARFRALADNTPDMISEHDEQGRLLYASPAVVENLGPGMDQPGAELLSRVAAEDRQKLLDAVSAAARDGGRTSCTLRYRHVDGSWHAGEVSARVFETAEGGYRAVLSARDVTERLEIEARLRRQVHADQLLLGMSRALLDASRESFEARIPGVLEAAAQLGGGDRCFLRRIRGEPPELKERYEWCAPGVPSRGELPLHRDLRSFDWYDARIQEGLVYVPDVDAMPDEAAQDRRDLRARGVRALLGLPVHAEGRLIGYLGVERVREAGGWDGHRLDQLRLVRDILGTALERVAAEEALERSRRQQADSQKMEAVGRLAGGVAHDFNNLLMVIGGHGELLLDAFEAGDPRREDVRQIQSAVERAASLTRRLLAFGRPQPVSRRRLDLNALLQGLEEMLVRLLGEAIDLSFELDSEPRFVRADPHQLEQVVVNLALNGRDAMHPGGRLRISTGSRSLTAAEAASAGLEAGDYVRLAVRDEGSGMDEVTRRRLFEPFFTTKGPDKGTGLGLSIVYGVVQHAGGTIQVASTPGQGTEMRVLLPAADGVPDPAGEDVSSAPEGGGETVLLVEDEMAVRRVIRRVLEDAGYRVLEAGDGEQGEALAARFGRAIDLLVTDVVMPRAGGGELARRIWQQLPGLPVVFVSGYAREERVAEVLEAGEFLQKPFTRPELLAMVRRALECKNAQA